MPKRTHWVVLAILLSSAGCRAEMSDARRDHVLAGNHGWIDLTGYRVAVPTGKLQTELTIDGCVPLPVVVTLPLDLAKDHLARLVFDGSSLTLHSSVLEPASVE